MGVLRAVGSRLRSALVLPSAVRDPGTQERMIYIFTIFSALTCSIYSSLDILPCRTSDYVSPMERAVDLAYSCQVS